MAIYTPDYDYQNGEKFLEELTGPEGELIRYYVSQNEKHYQKIQEENDDMRKVFEAIRKYSRY